MHLKQFAFYTPGFSSNSKRQLRPTPHQKRHSHGHLHRERGVGDWITATINGDVVSWAADATSMSSTAAATSPTSTPPTPSNSNPKAKSSAATPPVNPGAGTWGRQAYYNAENNSADGLVFLNNHGGQGSGVFDYTRGSSLSYASPDSTSGSVNPQILSDTLLTDNTEAIIYTDSLCLPGDSCGTYRPGSVAYHGFSGSSKLFLLEFSMPYSNNSGFNMDMPAVWILNAAIPRTQQYGSCSCWPDCGEWDIFEILDSGNSRAKSTVHVGGDRSGGHSDFFERPSGKTIKAAVLFDGEKSEGRIVVLSDDTVFNASIADSWVVGIGGNDTDAQGAGQAGGAGMADTGAVSAGIGGALRSTLFNLGSGPAR